MQKKLVKTVIEVPTYHCDFCDFITESEDLMSSHEANEHFCKGVMPMISATPSVVFKILKFDSKECAEKWLCADRPDHRVVVCWQSPGWYFLILWESHCSKGCCREKQAMLVPYVELSCTRGL